MVRVRLPQFLAGDLVEIVHARAWGYTNGDIGMVTAMAPITHLSQPADERYVVLVNGVKTTIYAYEIKLHTGWASTCKTVKNVV